MKLTDIRQLEHLSPTDRSAMYLKLGAELHTRPRKAPISGTVPTAVDRETVMDTKLAPTIRVLHDYGGPEPQKVPGLRSTGRTLQTRRGPVPDLVLTPRERRVAVARAMSRDKDRSLNDLAIRQLVVGMMDSAPVSRSCAAYAYWQAVGAQAALPVLRSALDSEDEDGRLVAAYCLAKINMRHVRHLQGTARDDVPQTPANPVQPSMTVLVHGTFAKNHAWYQPGGGFHSYIKNNVYPDVYSAPDFYSWSGRYSLGRSGLTRIWTQAARKLVSWCTAHPARTLRLIAHSHGASVVNMATAMGLPACTLIQLSPAVRSWNLPTVQQISSGRLFNIHSRVDLVVTIDGGAQTYVSTPVAASETVKIIAFAGHSDSHDSRKWDSRNVPPLVKTVCP